MLKRRIPDLLLFISVILLLSIGISMVYSASIHKSQVIFQNSYHFLFRQVVWVFCGIFFMFISFNVDYHIYRKFSFVLIILSVLLLLAVFVPGLGKKVSGARRWLDLKFFLLNPTEIAKFSLIIYIASQLSRKKMVDFQNRYLPAIIVILLFAGLIILQPDFGSGVFLIITGIVLLFVDGIKIKNILLSSMAVLPFLVLMVVREKYRLRRIIAFLNPGLDPSDKGYHILQSLKCFKMGSITGLGFAQSKQKIWSLPAPHTDFIFSVYGEEAGFIGIVILVTLFIVFMWRGLKIALNAVDSFGFFLCSGFVFMIMFQTISNLFITLGIIPVTGVSLPFISYGGSAIIINLIMVGIMLNISKSTMTEDIAISQNVRKVEVYR